MKLKQHIKSILAIILFLNLILSSLLPVCKLSYAVSDIPDSDKIEGKETDIYVAKKGLKPVGSIMRYAKGNNYSLEKNLYCANRGGRLSDSYGTPEVGYVWKDNIPVFKDEDSYKKLTWIKNNFMEYIGQNEQDKFTIDEKYEILHSQDNTITKEDVEFVYLDEAQIFNLYQMIIWKYTKTSKTYNDPSLDGISPKAETKKIFNTITSMADKYYSNYNENENPSIKLNQTEIDKEVTNGEYRWGIEVNNTSILSYTMELTVNGQIYDNYIYENNVITIKGLDNNESYVFNVTVKSAYVKCEGFIWIAENGQDMIEITEGKKYEIHDSVSTNLDVKPEGKFKVVINKKDTENTPLAGINFNITGEATKEVSTNNERYCYNR